MVIEVEPAFIIDNWSPDIDPIDPSEIVYVKFMSVILEVADSV